MDQACTAVGQLADRAGVVMNGNGSKDYVAVSQRGDRAMVEHAFDVATVSQRGDRAGVVNGVPLTRDKSGIV